MYKVVITDAERNETEYESENFFDVLRHLGETFQSEDTYASFTAHDIETGAWLIRVNYPEDYQKVFPMGEEEAPEFDIHAVQDAALVPDTVLVAAVEAVKAGGLTAEAPNNDDPDNLKSEPAEKPKSKKT
ncbi:MAG: hypothetical protein V4563_17210 [Pseudomonadota bacterium]